MILIVHESVKKKRDIFLYDFIVEWNQGQAIEHEGMVSQRMINS